MANIKSAIKRLRQNKKRRLHNRYFRGQTRAHVKNARLSIDGEDLEAARSATKLAIKALDKAAEKKIIHKNNAARRKSRLVKHLNALEKQLTSE